MTTQINKHPYPTPLQRVMLQELVQVATWCYDRGWSWATAGNFSVRGSGGVIWQSASGICKRDLRADLFIPIDLQSERPLEGDFLRASAEMPVHLGIYKALEGAMCVVHTHPPHVVRYSKSVRELNFSGEEMAKALGVKDHLMKVCIPVMENPTPEAMRSFSSRVPSGIGAHGQFVVLAGHGVYAWGKTPLEALAHIEALEFLCEQRI